jgi:hypothetical protein
MEKTDIIKLLDEIFIPHGFLRKGNNWVKYSDELTKILNLQKSRFSNSFYINYGFIIKGLELTTTTHVEKRLASKEIEIQKRITNLLSLESKIPEDQRINELKGYIIDKIVNEFQLINTEKDLLIKLKKRSHLNDIPLVVKSYFKLV